MHLIFTLLFISYLVDYVSASALFNGQKYPLIQWGAREFTNKTVKVVLENDTKRWNGSIVYIVQPSGTVAMKPWRDRIAAFKKGGCIGVLTSPYDYRIPGILIYSASNVFPVPVGNIYLEVYDFIVAQGGVVNFTFIDWDPNPWDVANVGPLYDAFCVLVALMFFVNVALVTYRIILWIYNRGVGLNVGFVCLCLEWICNGLRCLQTVIIPNRNKYGLFGANILTTFPLCFSLITSVIIVFFWLDLTADPFYHGKFLGFMKIPAIIFIVLLIICEVSIDIVKILNPINNMATPTLGTYCALHALITLFSFLAAYRILKTIVTDSKDKKRKISRVTYLIIISGIINLCALIVQIFVLTDYLWGSVYGNLAIWFLLYLCYFGQSLFLIIIFRPVTGQHSKSSSLTSNSSKTKDKEKEKELTIET